MKSSVFITGATSGIGRQLAIDYAQSGYKVIACGRDQAALKYLEHQHNIETRCFDITDNQACHSMLSHLPFIPELWIFNAGGCEYMDNGVVDARLMARIMEVNVIGTVNCVEACQPFFLAGHRVVFIGSIASELALPRAEAYGASKAALSYFARSLSLDLKDKGITVHTVYPGFVQTPLTDKNTFTMPMLVSTEQASQAIRTQLKRNNRNIYFPAKFTWGIRLLSLLPYRWQACLVSKWIKN